MSKLRLFFVYYLPALVWAGLIFYLSSVPNLELQGDLSAYDLILRKLAHVAEYAVLSMLTYRANVGSLPSIALTKPKKALPLTLTLSVLYAISDEFHQYITPTRDGKVTDVLIDTIGIILGLWFYNKLTQGPTLSINQ